MAGRAWVIRPPRAIPMPKASTANRGLAGLPARWARILTLLIAALFTVACRGPQAGQRAPTIEPESVARDFLSDAEIETLREGDFILSRGRRFSGEVISGSLQEEFAVSHCGILVRGKAGFEVIHACMDLLSVGARDGVQSDPLDVFCADARTNTLLVSRLRAPEASRRLMVERAGELLRRGVAFDRHYDLSDASRLYCTEFLWRLVVEATGKDFFRRVSPVGIEKPILTFSALWDPRQVALLVNHHPRIDKADRPPRRFFVRDIGP